MKTLFKLTLCIIITLFAQDVFADDYREYAKKVREEVWTWDRPEFKNYNVPDEYKNESAVMLAWHNRIEATGKSKFRVNIVLAFNVNKELIYSNTVRQMIKINDKTSLDKYSEISYKEEDKRSGYMMTSKYKTIVGARIIKPNGEIKEVDVDEAVAVTSGKKDKEEYKKLAISDLQVGDILDYFIQDEAHVDRENIPPLLFTFASNKYPILSYSVHCEIGDKLTTEYRSINGAPEFTTSTNEDGDYILEAQRTNIPKLEGLLDRWVSPYRELPMIRMSILNNASKDIYKPKSARKNGLYKDIPSETILEDAKGRLADYYSNGMGDEVKQSKKMIDAYRKENPMVSDVELADYIYEVLQFSWIPTSYSRALSFVNVLGKLFKDYKIDYKVGIVTSKHGARDNELVNMYDLYYFVMVNDRIFTYNPMTMNIPGEVNPEFEGETALMILNPKEKSRTYIGEESRYKIPVTDENYNSSLITLNVGFSDSDPLLLNIEREVKNQGSLKNEFQQNFVTSEKWNEEIRQYLHVNKTVIEELEEKKSTRKYIDDYNAMLERDRKGMKDRFMHEINSFYNVAVKDIRDYEVLHLGITKEYPSFHIKAKYEMEGMVKKAGNNLILDAGKLIGVQLDLKDNDRKRNVDVYMPTSRLYEYQIQVQIPDGYTVENLSNLTRNIDNSAGSFVSSATIEGSKLAIKVRKIYKKAFLPVADWNKLLEMLDGANDFYAQSVVLKKQ